MGGVQLAKGGLINNAKNFFNNAKQASPIAPQNYQGSNLQRNIQGATNFFDKFNTQARAYPEAFLQNLPFTPDRQANLNRNIEDILGKKSIPTTIAQGANNWVGAPLAQVPYNIKEAVAGEDKSGWSRAGHGAQALFGLLPGVDDAAFAGYNSLKGAATKRDLSGIQPGLAGNEYFGLGDAVTGGNQDSLLTPALNMAELPLLLFGGLKAKNLDEVLQNNLKKVDGATPSYLKQKGAKVADFIYGENGVVSRVKEMTKKATNEFKANLGIPATDEMGNLGKQLPSGEAPLLQLPAPQQSVTVAQVKKLIKQGDNLDGVTVNVKNADEAREALKLGIPSKKIKLPENISKEGTPFYASPEGIGKTNDPLMETASKDISSARVPERGFLRKGYDYLMTQTPEKLKRVFGDEFYNKHIDPIYTNLNKASRSADDFIHQNLTSIGQSAEDFNIKVGSADEQLLYTLRDKGIDAVIKKVGTERAAQIQAMFDVMRKSYDEAYAIAAPIADRLGKKLPKKENFLSQQGNKDFGFGLDLTSDKTITGEFSASLAKQQGDVKNVSPLKAYTLYMNKLANLIFLEPEAKQIENLSQNIAFNKNTNRDMLSSLEDLRKSITGEGKEISSVEKLFDSYFGTTKAAAVVGKASTLINQVLGIPAAASNSGWWNFIKGNLDPKTRALVKEKSALFSSIDRQIPKSLQGSKIHQRIFQGMANALQKANKFGYEVSLRGFVKQAEEKGIKNIDEIVAEADKMASRVLGDRREWMQPKFYDTFFGKLMAPFTQEQTAQAASFLQNIGDKKAATVMKTLISWKIGNEIWDKVAGFSPFFDPISAGVDVAELLTGSDEKEKSNIKAFMRVVEEGMTLMPPVQSIFNQAYSVGDTLGILPDAQDTFANDRTWMSTGSLLNPLSNIKIDFNGKEGEKWLPRNITGNKVVDIGLNIAAKYVPGVEQFNRSVQAGNSLSRGYSESRKGNPLFEMPKDIAGKAQALIFGQNSTKNAQDMFSSDFDWGLTSKQGDIIEKIPTKQGKIDYLNSTKKLNTADKKLDSILKSSGSDVEIDSALLSGKSAKSKSIKERMSAYKELNKILSDDTIPQSAKDEFIKASGADPKDAAYYTMAAQDIDVKLQDEILPKLDTMSNEQVMEYLGSQRKVVGGKQMLTSDMIEYLYDKDYISKKQKAALKALKYDEIKDEFYYDKDYKGGGSGDGGTMTYKQALKAFQIELPKFSKLKSLDLMFEPMSSGASQTTRQGNTLLSNILSRSPKTSGNTSNKKLWFNQV